MKRGFEPFLKARAKIQLRPRRADLEIGSAMQILFYVFIVLHLIVCFFLIGVVLIQQGRSADLAGAFGGQGSQTAFGPRAAANVLTRLTTWSAIIFMCTSIGLVVLYNRASSVHSVLQGSGPAPISTPAK